mgnify:CR=1 FL=1
MTALSYSRVQGANGRVQVGLIGAGERGRQDTSNFVKTGKADVAAVCDIFGNNIEDAMGPIGFLVFYLLCGLAASFAQIAAWSEADIDRIDAQLGTFAGRIRRDNRRNEG